MQRTSLACLDQSASENGLAPAPTTNRANPVDGQKNQVTKSSRALFFPLPASKPADHDRQLPSTQCTSPHRKDLCRLASPRTPTLASKHDARVARPPRDPLAGSADGLSPPREHRRQQDRRRSQADRLQGPAGLVARRQRSRACHCRRRKGRRQRPGQDWRPHRTFGRLCRAPNPLGRLLLQGRRRGRQARLPGPEDESSLRRHLPEHLPDSLAVLPARHPLPVAPEHAPAGPQPQQRPARRRRRRGRRVPRFLHRRRDARPLQDRRVPRRDRLAPLN